MSRLRSRIWWLRGVVRFGVLVGLAVVAAAFAVTVVLPTGTAPQPPAASPSPGPTWAPASPDPAVDLRDADAVCRGFAAALFTTAAIDGPHDPYRRAAAYTTTGLAAALTAEQGRRPWSPPRRDSTDEPKVDSYIGDHLVPDTDQVAHRAAVVTATGTQAGQQRHIVYCTLHQTGAVWRVAAYERERTLP